MNRCNIHIFRFYITFEKYLSLVVLVLSRVKEFISATHGYTKSPKEIKGIKSIKETKKSKGSFNMYRKVKYH